MRCSWTFLLCVLFSSALINPSQAQNVTGNIQTPDGVGVKNVSIQLTDVNNVLTNGTTDDNGDYAITTTAAIANWEGPEKIDDPSNGLSTLDLVLISNHILNIEPFTSPYKLYAADVNRTGAVTTFDLVLISRQILGWSSTDPTIFDWRFIPSDYVFTQSGNRFNISNVPEGLDVVNSVDSIQQDFIGIKPGDVNCTAKVDSLRSTNPGQVRSTPVYISLPNLAINPGEALSIPFRVDENTPTVGFQFVLQFDPEVMEYTGLIDNTNTPSYRNFIGLQKVEEGEIRVSWYGDILDVDALEEVLFSLNFTGKKMAQLDEILTLHPSNQLSPELYQTDDGTPGAVTDIRPLDLKFETSTANRQVLTDQFQLQATPNPFTNQTQISFSLTKSETVHLRLHDLMGRLLVDRRYDLPAGAHQVPVLADQLAGKGMYLLSLSTATEVQTMKIQQF